ncbi:hypothetical protein HPB50_028443 [Hyalomma asiaticum]|nr:hypothetical protein HPB50_028443 [Hyalomma asiaticum]
MDLTLVTDKSFPKRIGNSVSRDTAPYLALVENAEHVGWDNTAVEFGSDHYTLETHFKMTRSSVKQFKFVEWDHFRKIREERGRARARASLDPQRRFRGHQARGNGSRHQKNEEQTGPPDRRQQMLCCVYQRAKDSLEDRAGRRLHC